MHFVRSMFVAVLYILPLAILAGETTNEGSSVEIKGNVPWRPDNKYDVVSKYEMRLGDLVLSAKELRGKDGWFGKKSNDVVRISKSDPFGCTYKCELSYTTYDAKQNGSQGSVFRDYGTPSITFVPPKKDIHFLAQDGWSGFWGLEEVITTKDAEKQFKDADFFYKEVYEPDNKHMDTASTYFMHWMKSSDIEKKIIKVSKTTPKLTHKPSDKERNEIIFSPRLHNYTKCSENDLAYNVIQSEAKIMTFAIYGQDEPRKEGDVWAIDAKILESFLPLLPEERQPFLFDGGIIVLQVTYEDENGNQVIEMVPGGVVNHKYRPTDLKIKPNVKSVFRPSKIGEYNVNNRKANFIKFYVDTENDICTKAIFKVTLNKYSGPALSLGDKKFEFTGKKYKGRPIEANIESGTIVLAAELETTLNKN